MVTPFRIDPDTLDRLVDRIVFEMAEDRDSTVLRDVLAGQVAIVTQLETENAVLWAFVETHDERERYAGSPGGYARRNTALQSLRDELRQYDRNSNA